MRKILLASTIILIGFVIYACNKKTEIDSTTKILELKYDPSKIVSHSKIAPDNPGLDDEEGGVGYNDPCWAHGGQVAVGVSWQIATCKSNCTRGIGFRCGHKGYVRCKDGSVFPFGGSGGRCPKNNSISRIMNGDYTFYNNGFVKITFRNKLPEDEIKNNNFEIEDEDLFELPNFISIGGTIYSGFWVPIGIYNINHSDGEFGSVTLPITLVI